MEAEPHSFLSKLLRQNGLTFLQLNDLDLLRSGADRTYALKTSTNRAGYNFWISTRLTWIEMKWLHAAFQDSPNALDQMAQMMMVKPVVSWGMWCSTNVYIVSQLLLSQCKLIEKVFLGPSPSRDDAITAWPIQMLASEPGALPRGLVKPHHIRLWQQQPWMYYGWFHYL